MSIILRSGKVIPRYIITDDYWVIKLNPGHPDYRKIFTLIHNKLKQTGWGFYEGAPKVKAFRFQSEANYNYAINWVYQEFKEML